MSRQFAFRGASASEIVVNSIVEIHVWRLGKSIAAVAALGLFLGVSRAALMPPPSPTPSSGTTPS